MARWDVRIGSHSGDVGSYVELSIDGDRCVSFDSPREIHDFIQQLPAIGAQLKAASRDAFQSVRTAGAASDARTDGSTTRGD